MENANWRAFLLVWYYVCRDHFKGNCSQKCAYCSILMNSLNFIREFKNFTDFKNVRISEILFAMMYWNKSCFRVFSMFFSSSKLFLYQCKESFFYIKSETTFMMNFVEVYFYYCQPGQTCRKFTCQCFTQILQINTAFSWYFHHLSLICNFFF